MARFTLQISDDLNIWLIQNAKQNKRSKNKQIEYLLSQIHQENKKQRCYTDLTAMCANGNHNFKNYNPAMSDFCNCGMFVYGEIMR